MKDLKGLVLFLLLYLLKSQDDGQGSDTEHWPLGYFAFRSYWEVNACQGNYDQSE